MEPPIQEENRRSDDWLENNSFSRMLGGSFWLKSWFNRSVKPNERGEEGENKENKIRWFALKLSVKPFPQTVFLAVNHDLTLAERIAANHDEIRVQRGPHVDVTHSDGGRHLKGTSKINCNSNGFFDD